MSEQPLRESHGKMSWVHSTRLHLVMYSVLLVAAPFLMIRRYMQEAIGMLTDLSIEVVGVDIVIVPVAALIFAIIVLIAIRHHLTLLRLVAAAVAILLIALAQRIADYYFHHNFYDLQQNWHYFAYGIFAFMVYRDLVHRGFSLARIILITFVAAVCYSTFDEAFQLKISSRVFDLGDIAKDAWGAVIGMSFLYLGENPRGSLLRNWRPIRHKRLRAYLDHSFSMLLLCAMLTLLFLIFGSHLSEPRYGLQVILFTLSSFITCFLVLHISQFSWGRIFLLTCLVLAVGAQTISFCKYGRQHIVHTRPGLTVYKGIPLWYFDYMIFPDGRFRIVDKKEYFYSRDRAALMRPEADIVIVASGHQGSSGRGFPEEGVHQFNYNKFLEEGTQVIILENPEACELFNRLKGERKNVLLVLHNTG